MLMLGFFAIAITLGIGWGVRWYGLKTNQQWEISVKEYLICSLVMCLLVTPLTLWGGRSLAISNQVTFNENWNGWETRAEWIKTTCTRDGICRHCYDCDPYTVSVPYDCSYTDSDGKTVSKTCYRDETRYHSCPYASEEWYFGVKTTLGNYVIAGANVPTNPQNYRYRRWTPVPSWLESGIPDRWTEVKQRLDAGNPGPVTSRETYENYILASQTNIIRRYNDSVDTYLKANLLPAIRSDIYNFYYLDRVYPVGVSLSGDWQSAINRFNAALGTSLQGDLHLVVVDSNKVTNSDNYLGALMAYWQGDAFKKDALSKNGIDIVVGTKDGKTIEWARSATGMPVGNEHLMVQIQNDLKGAALDPKSLLGYPVAKVLSDDKVSVITSDGLLEKILWGQNKFSRVHMKPRDGDGGFAYLLYELEPTSGQKTAILFAVLFFGLIGWGICIMVGDNTRRFRFR